jgi:histidinol phosphatase-like PHP family hydrolase
MTKITKISNLHIHNSNSRCAWNRYPIKMVYAEAKKANLKYVGSSNHIFPKHDSSVDGLPEDGFQRHITWTKEEVDALDLDIPFYVGCELDILNEKGKHFMLPKYEKMVDYWIAGMHSYFNLNILKEMYVRPNEEREEFLMDYFEEWGDWAVNYITKSKPNIFVHIFWQELEYCLFHEKSMNETAQRIFEAAANAGTAIECSSLQIRRRYPKAPFWVHNDPRGEHVPYFMSFYKNLFKMAKETGCMVSFGSDAHEPEDIGDVIRIKDLLEDVGFTDNDIFQPTKI